MKFNSKNVGLLMITLVATSVGATYLVSSTASSEVEVANTGFVPKILGNVKVAVYDKDTGQVKAYRQTDNHIVVNGMAIIAAQVFNDTQTTGNYPVTTDDDTSPGATLRNFTGTTHPNGVGTVKYMDIGNGSGNVAGWNNVTLAQALKDAKPSSGGWPNCPRILADLKYMNQSKTSDPESEGLGAGTIFDGNAEINVTAVATFDGADCAAGDIQEAGIWTDDNGTGAPYHTPCDSSGTGGCGGNTLAERGLMFARNTFLPVSLSTSDSLELTWTFTFTDS